MKKIVKICFLILTSLCYLKCSDSFLEKIIEFKSNSAPVILDISSDQSSSNELGAGQTFLITVKAADVDGDDISVNYLSDIGVFTNHKISGSGSNITSTINYTLPDTIPAGLNVDITVQVSDPKGAMSSKNLSLGNARVGLGVTLLTDPGVGLFIHPKSSLNLQWVADGDGFFQVKLTDDIGSCTIDEAEGFDSFIANTPKDIKVCGASSGSPPDCFATFENANEQQKLCIIVRDNLLQDSILTATLTSDDSLPVSALEPELEGGIYPDSKTATISCTDNYSCSQISYLVGISPVTENPDFSGINGTVVDGSSTEIEVGLQGNGDYQLKYVVSDSAGNQSLLETVNFAINDQAPLISIVPPQPSNVSTNGNITSEVKWECNKPGISPTSYRFEMNTCSPGDPGNDLTLGSSLSGNYPSANTEITSIIDAGSLAPGASSIIKICFIADNGISSDGSITIARDDNAPVIDSIEPADGELSVDPNTPVIVTFNKSVDVNTVTTNLNSSCTGSLQVSSDNFSTCVPMSLNPPENIADKVFKLTPVLLNGLTIYKVKITDSVKDLSGNAFAGQVYADGFTTFNDPGVISVTSSTDNGTYGLEKNISIEIFFSCPVFVSGTPVLNLNTGNTATYISGSGTETLTFSYTVEVGDENTTDLDYFDTDSLSAGGSIVNSTGVDANLTLPAPGSSSSIAGSKDIKVLYDIINVTSSSPNGTYTLNQLIIIEVEFSYDTYLTYETGWPRIQLNTGAYAEYTNGSGTTTFLFEYLVGRFQSVSDLNYSSITALEPNGSIIRDISGNTKVLTLPELSGNYSLAYNKNISVNSFPVLYNNGTWIHDSTNGLEFQKCLYGQEPPDCTGSPIASTIFEAIAYCENIYDLHGHPDWRMANRTEHYSIYNPNFPSNNYADPAYFPNMPLPWFWTEFNNPLACFIRYESVWSNYCTSFLTDTRYFRCVRDL